MLCDEADRLFLSTEYEQALILYHRAQRQRPNCQEARQGIRRCQDCINTLLVGEYKGYDIAASIETRI